MMRSNVARGALAVVASGMLFSCGEPSTAPTALATGSSDSNVAVTFSLPDVVISQVYGGGGNSGATYTNDFIELFNPGADPVSLDGWSVQYASSSGSSWQVTALSGTIQPGGYYLVQEAAGAGGTTPLPSPDASGGISMSASAGKVVLASQIAALAGACPEGTGVVDRVGYGGTNCGTDWIGNAPGLNNTTAALRNDDGCAYTGDPSTDFATGSPAPRNSGSPSKDCDAPPMPPSDATIAINELMADPLHAAGGASWGEWFEVHNYGAEPIDLEGWSIVSAGQPAHGIASSVVVPAGGYAVLGRGDDTSLNGGVTIDYNYFTGTATTIWLDATDHLVLRDTAGARVDSVRWNSAATFVKGVTRGLRDATQDNTDVDGANWGYSTTTFGDGDLGTPGAPNGPLDDTPPEVPHTISFSGRRSSDPPLPVGFEDQLFATLRDGTGEIVETMFTWSSETPEIASIDSNGVMRAVAEGAARFRATAADGTTATYSLPTAIATSSTTAMYTGNTELGVPADMDTTDDLIVTRDQYTASWNPSRGVPNWVSYNLEASHFGAEDRCDCFTFDPEAPSAPYTTADYTGAGDHAGYGIDRGHLVRSFDRTAGSFDNATTYYFSNIIPQAADNNQGPWASFENHLGDLARFENMELYVIAGAAGSKGTVKDEGKITIPSHVWKVAVILSRDEGLDDVNDHDDLEVIAVIMPNDPGIRDVAWETYLTTVDSVESLSGYDLLALLPDHIEIPIEAGTGPLSPAETIEYAAGLVHDLVDTGALRRADGKRLVATLNAALAQLERRRLPVAVTLLRVFLRQVDAFVQIGKLAPAQANALRAPVQAVIDSIG